ncbi:MAG: hypothetical protein HQM09_16640 [Candidatus Riflebacteria bacterium]|nr:hypothetical protein [Candidatus Riflebacteria bacterium]
MKTFIDRFSKLFMVVLFIATSAMGFAQTATSTKPVSSLTTLSNYDVKLRISKIVMNSIQEDKKAGRPISLTNIKDQIFRKPIMAQVAIDQGMAHGGKLVQLGLASVCPPYGLIAGSLLGGVMGSFGGAIGYETSVAMESKQKLNKKETLGKALYNIDLPLFIGRNIGSMAGAFIGQALIPIPWLGTVIGAAVGGVIGGFATDELRKIGPIGRFFDKFQSEWQKVGSNLMKSGQKNATATATLAPINPATIAQPDQTKPSNVSSPYTPRSFSDTDLPANSSTASSESLQKAYDAYLILYNKYNDLSKSSDSSAAELTDVGNKLQAAKANYLQIQATAGK